MSQPTFAEPMVGRPVLHSLRRRTLIIRQRIGKRRMERDVFRQPHPPMFRENHVVKDVAFHAVTVFHIGWMIGSAAAPVASDPFAVGGDLIGINRVAGNRAHCELAPSSSPLPFNLQSTIFNQQSPINPFPFD